MSSSPRDFGRSSRTMRPLGRFVSGLLRHRSGSCATRLRVSSTATSRRSSPACSCKNSASSRNADGARCLLESRLGSLVVRLRHDPRQRTDTVLVPKGGHLRDGRCANTLIRAQTTDLGEGGALYDEPVRLSPLPADRV